MKEWGDSSKVFIILKRAKVRIIAALRKSSEIETRKRRRKMGRKIYEKR
jgi:hypothetical protein